MKCRHPFARCPDMTGDRDCLREDIGACPLKRLRRIKMALLGPPHRLLCRMGWHGWEEHRHRTGKARRRCRWCRVQFRGVWSPLPLEARGKKDFKRRDRELRRHIRFE